jgi:hypothetical protein
MEKWLSQEDKIGVRSTKDEKKEITIHYRELKFKREKKDTRT